MVARPAGLRPGAVTSRNSVIDAVVHDAIERRVFPGAVVIVSEAGAIRHAAAYGATTYDGPGTQPVTLDTRYDIASLTKVFTATAALRLYEAGALDLRAPVSRYLPHFKVRDVCVEHLLTHTSGLDLRLSILAPHGRNALLDAVYNATLKHPPGTSVAYTNINSLLLGELVAQLCGTPLDQAVDELVLAPLGLGATCFRPARELLGFIAPTEHDDHWRGGLVHGTVHDESAHALGGVAGHAGLFSIAADLHRFCMAWLEPLATGFLGATTAARAITNQTAGLNLACGLGWMLDRPNFMGNAPAGSFGHTGFTGPALIVIPERRLIVVVLSNRVFPRRGPPHHHPVTAAIVNATL
jgi:CubicO group peptidase (beta-lactamase class C family)